MQLKKHHLKLLVGNVPVAMDADKTQAFDNLSSSLINIIDVFLDRNLPLRRITLVSSLLNNCNIISPNNEKLLNRIMSEQKSDGGWIDCEDSAWALYCLSHNIDFEMNVKTGLSWLEKEKDNGKGWGFCKRDKSCIPITAQILYLLPHFHHDIEPIQWLEEEWNKDLTSPIQLNYKAAWYLLAYNGLQNKTSLSAELFDKTISYLLSEQREDGGWGPWKKHPAPTDCFITGICMAALALSYPISKDNKIVDSLTAGIQWVKNNQLENGLFPTHYIEEGSAWILFGWSKALNITMSNKI